MEQSIILKKIKEFIESNYKYKHKLLEHVRKGIYRLTINFEDIAQYDPDIAFLFLDEPQQTLELAEAAIKSFNLEIPAEIGSFKVRIKNSVKHNKRSIRLLRSVDVDKFITVRGVIRSRTSVTPRITTVRYECPNCGNIITVLQLDDKLREPKMCSCGRKGKFNMLSKTLIDGLSIRLEENPEDTESNRLESINALIQCDLTEDKIESKLIQGRVVELTGIYKTVMRDAKDGSKLTQLSTYLDVNYIEFLEEEESNLKITKEDIEQFKKYKDDSNFLEKASKNIFYKIEGHDNIKEVLTLQAFSGVPVYGDKGKLERRGTITILLCGEPGCCKSFFLNQAKKLHPKHYSVMGGRSTSVGGLLYVAVRDELLGQWSIDAGVFPLAHNGIVMIDELDKFEQKELDQLHGPMEDQVIYVNKANIKTTLKCECSILAASNPKQGRFSSYSLDFLKEMELSTTLVNRFDLIYLIKDEVNFEKDKAIALKMLRINKDKPESYIDNVLFKKYVLYAKKINPTFDDGIEDHITTELAKLKGLGKGKSYPITQRQYVTVFRLAEAKARSRLSKRINMSDVYYAINILLNNLKQFLDEGADISTLDIDQIEIGTRTSERNMHDFIFRIIFDYIKANNKSCPVDHIVEICSTKGIDELQMDKTINNLKKYGEIYEARSGFLNITG